MQRSSCSPFIDMLSYQGMGTLPYIGKGNKDTRATFDYPWSHDTTTTTTNNNTTTNSKKIK